MKMQSWVIKFSHSFSFHQVLVRGEDLSVISLYGGEGTHMVAFYKLLQNTSVLPLQKNCSGFWSFESVYQYLPNSLWCLCVVSLQCRWGSEALCDLQHRSGLRLCRALQPVQLPEGAGAPLPADIPRSAQRLPQCQACLPCPRTDAFPLQIKSEWEERLLSSIFSYSFY